jgi:hypothetical protein
VLDVIVGFGGIFVVFLIGCFAWWRLGISEERERREREAAGRPEDSPAPSIR